MGTIIAYSYKKVIFIKEAHEHCKNTQGKFEA